MRKSEKYLEIKLVLRVIFEQCDLSCPKNYPTESTLTPDIQYNLKIYMLWKSYLQSLGIFGRHDLMTLQ